MEKHLFLLNDILGRSKVELVLSYGPDPFTVTVKGCKLSYILPFSCEIKMILGRNQRISVKKNFKEFSK